MVISCGIYLLDVHDKLLIAHPTNGNYWSIPKGLMEEGETFLETAYREFEEETNVNLLKTFDNFLTYRLPSVRYAKKPKVIESMVFKMYGEIPLDKLSCPSMVECANPFPENDDYKWVSLDGAVRYLSMIQTVNIQRIKEFLENVNKR